MANFPVITMHMHRPFVIADCFSMCNKLFYPCRDMALADT